MAATCTTRILALSAALAAATALHPAGALRAQMHKVDKPQDVTRAVGVYEWTGELPKPDSARLVPVTLFIHGQLEDAGVYLARPVPFALGTGIVYEVEKAGEPVGTVSLDSAQNITTRRAATDDNPITAWYGYGAYAAPKAAPAVAKLKPSASLPAVVASSDSGKPRFSNSRSSTDSAAATPSAGSSDSQPNGTQSAPTPRVEVDTGDDDRPHMARRSQSDTASSASDSSSSAKPSSGSTSAPPDADDPDRPTLKKRDDTVAPKDKKRKDKDPSYVEAAGTQLDADPNRPTMRRGKPLEGLSVQRLTGNPPTMHQAVAVSDATNRDPHEFSRTWESPDERATILAGVEQLARPRVQNYLIRNQLQAESTASEAPAAAAKKKAPPAPPPPLSLQNEQLSGYSLSYGGLPTFVYTAEVAVTEGGPVYVTLVAQRLPAGELQVSLASVTDANHLDRTPWLRPIDAVDADASHRASLLFELRAQSSRQFALYRLISAQAEQTFLSNVIE